MRRRAEVANNGSVAEIVREFGSVGAAATWMREQDFWEELAKRCDAMEGELRAAASTAEPLSHKQWRADQISEGMPVPPHRLHIDRRVP